MMDQISSDTALELTLTARGLRACAPLDGPFRDALRRELDRPADLPAHGAAGTAALLSLAARAAGSDATLLIEGPTGTGKEVMARYVHRRSAWAAGPFVAVNCAALPEAMLEALLFGHERGAFTGAAGAAKGLFRAADGGTLFLDEVAELPLGLQAKLLRALQEREVLPLGATVPVSYRARIIAAGNRDLADEVAEGRFRADLYYRLRVLPLELRPLAARRDDILPIAAALLLTAAGEGGEIAWIEPAAADRLCAHDWPGNVRELDNVLQRARLLGDGRRIGVADLRFDPVRAGAGASARLGDIVRDQEHAAIEAVLAETGGRRLAAAARLGISERTLRYKLAEMARLRGGKPAGAALQ